MWPLTTTFRSPWHVLGRHLFCSLDIIHLKMIVMITYNVCVRFTIYLQRQESASVRCRSHECVSQILICICYYVYSVS